MRQGPTRCCLLAASTLALTACGDESDEDRTRSTDPSTEDEPERGGDLEANPTLEVYDDGGVELPWEADGGVRSEVNAAGGYVSVPSNYVYDPDRGTLHDYCSCSPDEYPNPAGSNANFRGPCARHDLCLGGDTPGKTCDKRLWNNLVSNCFHEYVWYNPVRVHCVETATIYYAAVRASGAARDPNMRACP